MSSLVDRYLLFRIRTKHDPEAFAEIYDRYVKVIFRFARLKMPSESDAQDITSEAFVRLWKYLLSDAQVKSVQALLFQIARRCIADFYRKSLQTQSIESVTYQEVSTTYLIQTVEAEEARAELTLVLERIHRLKDDYRDVVMMRLLEGMTYREIGTAMEKTAGSVRVMYHRALKMVKSESM